jgi:hypothetical protein
MKDKLRLIQIDIVLHRVDEGQKVVDSDKNCLSYGV